MFATKITNDILSLAENKSLSDNISIYSLADKDCSVTITVEWTGADYHEGILKSFNDIKNFIINTKKEVVEQISPRVTVFGNTSTAIYRFRIWDVDGKYEYYDKLLVSN